ncbi:MAG TPA: RidA family protein [Arsenicitalea sp.]|jgi:enamine deaminase RidA (YjgF/YER057c/UK114 family)|nr:RidA family protein [Arsenicitalea sp.]
MSASELATGPDATPYERIKALGLVLPAAPSPIANFVTHVREGNFLFLSGQGPTEAGGVIHTGKVGAEVSIESAYAHARLTGLNLIAVMHEALGDLARVGRIVKLFGMVNATPDFADHPSVINGCSDLLIAVFGQRGIHARSAVGFGSLPNRITVEIEAIVAIA